MDGLCEPSFSLETASMYCGLGFRVDRFGLPPTFEILLESSTGAWTGLFCLLSSLEGVAVAASEPVDSFC